jgi:hypothetical protein
MMAKGKTNHIRIMNQIIPFPKDLTWNVPYYGATQYVVGVDEEACLNKIRQKMQRKYEGFRIIHQETI